MKASKSKLERVTFQASRNLEYCSRKELVAQTGHDESDWPLVILKELVDNALDACEEAGTAPEIEIVVDADGIRVSDNGPGIPTETVEGALDFNVKASSKEAYVSPTRGAQGNALKTILAMPCALSGDEGRVTITAKGVCHRITLWADQILQEPRVEHLTNEGAFVKNGTSVQVYWPVSSSSLVDDAKARFLQIAADYIFLNPHLTLTLEWFGEQQKWARTEAAWQKWLPSKPTSPHWYTIERFERLVAAHLARESHRLPTVRELLAEFSGLAGSLVQKRVLEETGLLGADLSSLRRPKGLNHVRTRELLQAMKRNTKPIKAKALGFIGEDHLAKRFGDAGCEMATFKYRRAVRLIDGLPWVIETAFAWRPSVESRCLITGVNWSPGILNPFRNLGQGQSLDELLQLQWVGSMEPTLFLLNLTCPRMSYTDRGKSAVSIVSTQHADFDEEVSHGETKQNKLAAQLSKTMVEAVTSVTRKWCKQRKAEERNANSLSRRRQALIRSNRVSVKEVANEVMEAAYLQASSNGKLPAHARQLMYAARGAIQERTGEILNDQYFCQRLLPDYLSENAETTAHWDVVFDARGRFAEPHTGLSVPLGTLDVRNYLRDIDKHENSSDPRILTIPNDWRTLGPRNRYSAILFIEKEGFLPLFRAVRLAERFDIAIMSTKGLSVTASRTLVDQLCAIHEIPLFVLHDFDKSGFSILGTLQHSTRRFTFQNKFQVIDLGLRLQDVKDWSLQSEDVAYDAKVKMWPGHNLAANGATEEEIAFLCDTQRSRSGHFVGRRVELNAFTSRDLVTWIEKGLIAHGIKKLIPGVNTLETAFRQAVACALVERRLEEVRRQAQRDAESVPVPLTLQAQIHDHLHHNPELPWDKGIATIATAAAHQFSV